MLVPISGPKAAYPLQTQLVVPSSGFKAVVTVAPIFGPSLVFRGAFFVKFTAPVLGTKSGSIFGAALRKYKRNASKTWTHFWDQMLHFWDQNFTFLGLGFRVFLGARSGSRAPFLQD